MKKTYLQKGVKLAFTVLLVLAIIQVNAQKIECFILKLPEKKLDNVKKIAVLNFEGKEGKGQVLSDYIVTNLLKEDRGISSISGSLFSFSGPKEGKTYMQGIKTNIYAVLERAQLDKILAEQKLSLTGAIDENEAAEVGKLLGVDAIIVGSATYNSVDKDSKTSYTDKKTGKTLQMICTERKVTAEGRIKIVSVSTGMVVGTTNYSATRTDNKCDEKRSGLMPPSQMADECYKEIADRCTNYFAPHFVYSKFPFEKIRVKEYKDKAKDAEDFIDKGDINNAFKVYKAIFDADNYNQLAAYNVGMLYEMVGDFQKAQECYDIAYQIDNKNDDYYKALNRAKQGVELVKNLATIGVTLKEYTFEEAGSAALAAKVTTKGNKKDRIEVYESMENGSNVVAKVPGDTEFTVLETNGDWVLIKLLGNKQGYIQKSKVK
jgi:tetratricopeptide (TPR) repeat protein